MLEIKHMKKLRFLFAALLCYAVTLHCPAEEERRDEGSASIIQVSYAGKGQEYVLTEIKAEFGESGVEKCFLTISPEAIASNGSGRAVKVAGDVQKRSSLVMGILSTFPYVFSYNDYEYLHAFILYVIKADAESEPLALKLSAQEDALANRFAEMFTDGGELDVHALIFLDSELCRRYGVEKSYAGVGKEYTCDISSILEECREKSSAYTAKKNACAVAQEKLFECLSSCKDQTQADAKADELLGYFNQLCKEFREYSQMLKNVELYSVIPQIPPMFHLDMDRMMAEKDRVIENGFYGSQKLKDVMVRMFDPFYSPQ